MHVSVQQIRGNLRAPREEVLGIVSDGVRKLFGTKTHHSPFSLVAASEPCRNVHANCRFAKRSWMFLPPGACMQLPCRSGHRRAGAVLGAPCARSITLPGGSALCGAMDLVGRLRMACKGRRLPWGVPDVSAIACMRQLATTPPPYVTMPAKRTPRVVACLGDKYEVLLVEDPDQDPDDLQRQNGQRRIAFQVRGWP